MAYNFLPPFQQWAESQNSSTPSGPGNLNRLDGYLPQYQLSFGDLVPLEVDVNNVPTNLTGITGPVGSTGGTTGDPPMATPFAMFIYGQTVNGIIQFVLMDTATLFPDFIDTSYNSDFKETYLLVPYSDILDLERVVPVYYKLNSFPTNSISFYDARSIQLNPTQNIIYSEIMGFVDEPYSSNPESFASWPVKHTYTFPGISGESGRYLPNPKITKIDFQFNEFVSNGNTSNTLETHLKAGKFYHPYQLFLDNGGSNGYTEYTSDKGYFTGYGPGYPVNINYLYVPITSNNVPILDNGIDTVYQDGQLWPGIVSLNVYNFKSSSFKNSDLITTYGILPTNSIFNGGGNSGNITGKFPAQKSTTGDIRILINILGNNAFIPAACSSNNNCTSSSDSYFSNNPQTIQAGTVNYMTYQFIPISQIKTPPTNLVTDFRNTDYSYTTLPQNIDFTPSAYNPPLAPGSTGYSGPTGYSGSFPIEIQYLIPTGSTGNLGITGVAENSILSGWMTNPTNSEYNCTREVTNNSYCGFLNYYESLYGISYSYGTCGATGPGGTGYIEYITNPYQVGACDPGDVCVPNYNYLNALDPYTTAPFICVNQNIGVTTENFTNYLNATPQPPSKGQNGNIIYPRYTPVPLTQSPGQTYGSNNAAPKKDNVSLIITIVVVVLILIIVIVIIIKLFKQKPTYNFKNAGR